MSLRVKLFSLLVSQVGEHLPGRRRDVRKSHPAGERARDGHTGQSVGGILRQRPSAAPGHQTASTPVGTEVPGAGAQLCSSSALSPCSSSPKVGLPLSGRTMVESTGLDPLFAPKIGPESICAVSGPE